jgi:hypothetical protein
MPSINECGEFGGMEIGRGKGSTQNWLSATLLTTNLIHLAWDRTRVAGD